MITIAREIIEDIHPRYEGDTIRDHMLPNTFPRRVVEIEFLEDDDRISEKCPECRRDFTIKAITWERMRARGPVCCYPCHMRHERYNNRLHEARVLSYISNHRIALLDDDLIA